MDFQQSRKRMATWSTARLSAIILLTLSSQAFAEEFEFRFDDLPNTTYLDRWMYPFNVSPGSRIQAPTFGAVGSEGFDERDGQFVLALNTAELGVEAGLAASRYQINSATLLLTETFGGYLYDPTYDPFTTYLGEDAAPFTEDDDLGRPLELYGVGFRGEFTEFAWPDGVNSEPPAFGSASTFGENDRGTRVVFAADASGEDVSNNVDALADGVNGFDPVPFAVAQLFKDDVELEPGEQVTANTKWVFELNVDEPTVQSYLASALASGQLGLTVTSMHETGVQGAGSPFPNPATANHFAFDGPVIFLDVDIVDGLIGDFDDDGSLTANDMDLLSAAIRNGATDPGMDLSADGVINQADREQWLDLVGSLLGDADLNGEVAFSDFLQLAQGYGNQNGWELGDFDGSGETQFPDFLLLASNYGRQNTADIANVPEPDSHLGYLALVVVMARLLGTVRTRAPARNSG